MVRKPGSKHSAPSSRVTARRNDWNSIRVLHQGPRPPAASRGRIHDRSPIRLPKHQKSLADRTVLAKVPDARVFRSGRNFAAWIGLTGRDHGTGGKHRPGRISKQGDRMLRALLITGASAYLRQQRMRGVSDPWLRDLLARRPYKVVMVALAAKTARIIWAMLAKGEPYRGRASALAAA